MSKKRFFQVLIVSLVMFSSAQWCYAKSSQNYFYSLSISKQYIVAENLIEEKKFSEALQIIEPILKANPNDTRARVALANVYSGMYKLNSAYDEYMKVLKTNPHNSDAHNGLGLLYYKKATSSDMRVRNNVSKFYDTALNEFNQAISSNSNNYKAYNNAGRVYQELGNIDKAEEYYRKSIEIEPGYAEAVKNLGTVLFAKNQVDEAIDKYIRSISLNKKNPSAYYHLGEAYIVKGDYPKAINYLNISLFQFSNSAPVHNMLGKAYELQGNEAAALIEYKKSTLIKPEYTAPYLSTADIYQRRGDSELAIAELRSAVSINPDFLEGKLKIADISLTIGKSEQAIKYYKEVMKNPDYSKYALEGLAKAYYMKAQEVNTSANYVSDTEYTEVEEAIKQAIQCNPNDIQLYLALLRVSRLTDNNYQSQTSLSKIIQNSSNHPVNSIIKGEALISFKKYKDANKEFEKALSFVNDKNDLTYLGEIFIMDRQYDVAKQAFNRVLMDEPGNKKALKGLERINKNIESANAKYLVAKDFYDQRQLMAAIESLRDCLALNPNMPQAQLLLAKLFEKNGYLFNAIEHYTAYVNLISPYGLEYRHYCKKIKGLQKKVNKLQSQNKQIKKYTRI